MRLITVVDVVHFPHCDLFIRRFRRSLSVVLCLRQMFFGEPEQLWRFPIIESIMDETLSFYWEPERWYRSPGSCLNAFDCRCRFPPTVLFLCVPRHRALFSRLRQMVFGEPEQIWRFLIIENYTRTLFLLPTRSFFAKLFVSQLEKFYGSLLNPTLRHT
jgi:hypothetical protein